MSYESNDHQSFIGQRVKITGNHPHTGETGLIIGWEILGQFNKIVPKVRLDDCPHGTDTCLITNPEQLIFLKSVTFKEFTENPNVTNVTIKKRGIDLETLKQAIEICEGDVPEIAQLLEISVRHAYRLINQHGLKDYFHETKADPENLIGDLVKDVIIQELVAMKNIPGQLNKQQVVLLIFLAKCKANFVEAKKEEKPLVPGGELSEYQNAIADAVDGAKEEFLKNASTDKDSALFEGAG